MPKSTRQKQHYKARENQLKISWHGELRTSAEWAAYFGVSRITILQRHRSATKHVTVSAISKRIFTLEDMFVFNKKSNSDPSRIKVKKQTKHNIVRNPNSVFFVPPPPTEEELQEDDEYNDMFWDKRIELGLPFLDPLPLKY